MEMAKVLVIDLKSVVNASYHYMVSQGWLSTCSAANRCAGSRHSNLPSRSLASTLRCPSSKFISSCTIFWNSSF